MRFPWSRLGVKPLRSLALGWRISWLRCPVPGQGDGRVARKYGEGWRTVARYCGAFRVLCATGFVSPAIRTRGDLGVRGVLPIFQELRDVVAPVGEKTDPDAGLVVARGAPVGHDGEGAHDSVADGVGPVCEPVAQSVSLGGVEAGTERFDALVAGTAAQAAAAPASRRRRAGEPA